jgi:hypothetical protein
MNDKFIFQFAIGDRPIFEKNGDYFYGRLVDKEQLAYGLFTDDPEGFEPVENMQDYEKIQEVTKINSQLRNISITSLDKGVITVVMEYAGEYEYFRLPGLKIGEVSDNLAAFLITKITRKSNSELSHPYIVDINGNTIKNNKKRL